MNINIPYQNIPAGIVRSAFSRMALVLVGALAYGPAHARDQVETTNAILSFRAGSGDLIGVQWKRPKLEIIAEARLGENFRILLPQPNYEANYFDSRDQVVRKVEKSPTGVILHYGPLKNAREDVDVHVTYEIRDTGSQLNFSIQVDNRTERPLAEVVYAMIGGQQGIGNRLQTESLVPGNSFSNLAPQLFSKFPITGEAVGSRVPAASYPYPGVLMPMGWMDVYNAKAGLGYYYANQDPETRVTALYTELHPYEKASGGSDNWPNAAELPTGEPIGLTLGWVNFPYTRNGTFRAGPLALQVHEGDWHSGAKLYRAWFDQHFKVAREANWLRQEMAWQSLVLLQPEDVILYRFKDLPRLAAEAKRYGVTTLKLLGWHAGGVDRGYPNYTPDPRLGTVEEFRKAMTDLRAMGVHPLLFGGIQVADTSTETFRTRYARFAVQGRWAPDWLLWGYGEGTIGARDIYFNGRSLHRNMALVSPAHREFREELLHHYLNRIQDGAEGLTLDKAQNIEYLDFNPSAPALPDQSLPQGVLTTLAEFRSRARKINPNVATVVWAAFDRAMPYVDATFDTFFAKDMDSTALLHTFPEWIYTIHAYRPQDFAQLNNGLRYGLVWVMAPHHHTASLDEATVRPLSRYVQELIRIRKQYAELLFHGRFNDTLGATVTGDKEHIRYSVFQSSDPKNVARATVVVNFGEREESVEVGILGKAGRKAKISVPFQPDRVAVLPVTLTLPPERAAVVVAE